MSRRNSVKKRKLQHQALLAEEKARLLASKKKAERRIVRKQIAATDNELAGALDKLVSVGDEPRKTTAVGAPLRDANEHMTALSRPKSGRIRKKRKKDVERAKKIRERMLKRGAMTDF